MSKTNLQHYKEELKAIFNEYYKEPSEIIREINARIGVEIKGYGFQSCTDAILIWMAQPYNLSEVIKPFRKEVATISKFNAFDGSQYIYIEMKDRRGSNLPTFPKGTMYKGMIEGIHYSLKELGL